MTGIEVILLIIGAMIFAASFIFTSKSDTPKMPKSDSVTSRRKILRIRL